MPLSVGETVGPYRIVEQLGQGGMATVFRAYHAALDRYVAIKVLHPAFTTDSNFLARFQREARVVARLEHPHIVPVYDYAEHAGAPYLVMKFVPGETLKARLARSPVSAAEILRCVEAVGSALEFAHGQGVLHRDIKPSNIMLAADGTIYLADFGLARMAQAGESTLSADTLLGTPSYMSPEQARGDKTLDAGTDIYSFGVVVYELAVGRVPFSGDTPYAVIHDHIFTPLPSPRSVNRAVPAGVEAVLLKALAKERASRYATVGEMVADLRRALEPVVSPGLSAASAALTFAPILTVASAPDAVTPSASASPFVAAQTVAANTASAASAAPVLTQWVPPGATPATAAPAVASPYRLQWWQVVAGILVLFACGLLALGALSRIRRQSLAATQTAIAAFPATAVVSLTTPTQAALPSQTPPATSAPATTPPFAPTAGLAQQQLLAAERALKAGQTAAALTLLDQAVAVDPHDTAVLLRAGDLALGHQLALEALRRYYVPGATREAATPDARLSEVQSHAALAFYAAAADQAASEFLDQQVSAYPFGVVPLIARQRYQIFFAGGQGALAQLEAIGPDNAPGALARLVVGDYYLSHAQVVEATRQYSTVAALRLANATVPDWIIREARCELDALKTHRANSQLEASCVALSLLLTGK